MILGLLATRVLSSIVYQATPKDPLILGGVVLAMLGVGILVCDRSRPDVLSLLTR